MSKTVDGLMAGARTCYYFLVEYGLIAAHWKWSFLKLRKMKWQRCSTQKRLEKAYAKFGAEVYSSFRGGETSVEKMPLFEQKLKLVEEAEEQLARLDKAIEEIGNNYASKRDEIKSKYQLKRSGSKERQEED